MSASSITTARRTRARLDDYEIACRQAKEVAAETVNIAGLERGEIGGDPGEALARLLRARGEREREPDGAAEVGHGGRRDFVQRGWRQPALQRAIERGHAEGQRPSPVCGEVRLISLNPSNCFPQ